MHESGPAAPGTGNWCNWTDRDHGGARVIITELKQMKNTKTHLDRIITPADFSLYRRTTIYKKLFCRQWSVLARFGYFSPVQRKHTRPPTRRPLQNFLIKIGGIGSYKTGSAAAAAQHFTSDAAVLPTDCERQINTIELPRRYCFPSCSRMTSF